MKNQERRREQRIPSHDSRFVFNHPNTNIQIICEVLNISRYGLGVQLPLDFDQELTQAIVPGVTIKGTLQTPAFSLPNAECTVRIVREDFLGLEYIANSTEFVKSLIALLSPSYIACSIYRLGDEFLASDIEAVYHGDEFECIFFKASKANPIRTVQIYAVGQVVALTPDKAEFVPQPLIRSMGPFGGYDFLFEFSRFSENKAECPMEMFFSYLNSIISQWKECPSELSGLITHHLQLLRQSRK